MDERTADERALTDQEPAPARSRHPLAKAAIRIAVGGAVIGVLLARGDVSDIGGALADARPGHILAAFGVILVGLVISAYRWHAYLRPLGLELPAPTLLRLYFVGTFFNAFLPTGIGGDAYKAMRLGRGPGTLSGAFASVFLDRYAGVVGLAAVGLAGVASRLAADDGGRAVVAAGVLAGGILVAAAIVLAAGERLAGRGASVGRWRIRDRLRRPLGGGGRGGRDPGAAARGVAAGIAFQGLVLAYHVLLLRALGLTTPVAAMAAIVVVATVATMIPLTLNGLGFREAAYVWGLGTYGVPHDAALAFALLVLGVLLGASAVGGIVYVAAGGEVRAQRAG